MNVRLLAITTVLLLVLSGCGYSPERDKDCGGLRFDRCQPSRVIIMMDADLTPGANLDGVIGADFTGAKNVAAKYRKR